MKDTIAAIATAPGRGGIGVVRISGPDVRKLLQPLLGCSPEPRQATLKTFRDAAGEPIDQGLALFFPAPDSYTGEDVLELQGHGGPVVMGLLLERCYQLGARLANPGEFSERAFLNGKIDLAQAEGIADLIEASSSQAARSAARSLTGRFSSQVHAVVESIIDLRMRVESTIDFSDEDIDPELYTRATELLEAIIEQLDHLLASGKQGKILREGIQVVLAGRPNVGKSSLMNALAEDDIAIVTDIAGTTRDAIRQQILIHGVPVHIIDTAGLRETQDAVEKIGISRSRDAIDKADVVLWICDARSPDSPEDQELLASLPAHIPRLRVFNKIDLARTAAGSTEHEIYLSAKSMDGIDLLKHRLLEVAGWQAGESEFIARDRHIAALHLARQHLMAATDLICRVELFAEELHLAQRAMNSITGEFTSDDLLGEIFSRFCIGK